MAFKLGIREALTAQIALLGNLKKFIFSFLFPNNVSGYIVLDTKQKERLVPREVFLSQSVFRFRSRTIVGFSDPDNRDAVRDSRKK